MAIFSPLNLIKSSILLLCALLFYSSCERTKKEPTPLSYVSELLGTYRSENKNNYVDGTTSVEFIQMEINESDTRSNAVDLTYIRSIKRYVEKVESVNQRQTWGPWKFKNVTVSEMKNIDHKETQFTDFGGRPGESIETILSVKGGLAGTKITLMIGTDYPSKNIIHESMVWLDKVN